MFRVQDIVLSEEIATAKFACDVTQCKGACCVVGDAGAPVSGDEIPIIRKAYRELKDQLSPEAVAVAEKKGIISGNGEDGYEINCVDNKECIFVQKNREGVATCAIQNAYYKNKFSWEKPVSCHLYPVRLKKIAGMEFANFEYIPDLCSAGCENGLKKGTWLGDFLKSAFIRRYGIEWYEEFTEACNEIRRGN